MAAKSRPLVSIVAALLLVSALIIAGLPASVQASPNSDTIVYVVKAGDRLVDIAARFGVSASAIVRANSLANSDQIYPGQRLIIPDASAASQATPAPTTVVSAPTPATTTTYTVQLGDTLASIARKYGLGVAALMEANGITNPDLIWVGQRLVIPAPAEATTEPTQTPTSVPPTALPTAAASSGTVVPVPTTNMAGQPPAATAVATAVAATPTPAPTAVAPTATPAPTLAEPKIHVVQAGETLSVIAKRYGVSVDALVAVNGLGSADLIRVGMRLIIPGPGSDGSAPAVTLPPGTRATKFVASISQQRCWLYSGETVIARWICSTGRRGAATRPGSYKIQSKMEKAYGSTWNIWMPYWLGIYWAGASENGIHGLPWDAKTGVQIWSGNVGRPITFGCVMLDNVNAKMLFDMAWIGMPVIVRP